MENWLMILREAASKLGIGISLMIGLSASAQASSDYCKDLIYNHGLASSAQFTCGYEFYNDNVIRDAKQCMAQAVKDGDDSELSSIMKDGFMEFKILYEEAPAPYKVCTKFVKDFPSFVQP